MLIVRGLILNAVNSGAPKPYPGNSTEIFEIQQSLVLIMRPGASVHFFVVVVAFLTN